MWHTQEGSISLFLFFIPLRTQLETMYLSFLSPNQRLAHKNVYIDKPLLMWVSKILGLCIINCICFLADIK